MNEASHNSEDSSIQWLELAKSPITDRQVQWGVYKKVIMAVAHDGRCQFMNLHKKSVDMANLKGFYERSMSRFNAQ